MKIAEMYELMSNPGALQRVLTTDAFPANRPLTAAGRRWLRRLLSTAAFAEVNRDLQAPCARMLLDEAATRVQLSDFWELLNYAPVKIAPDETLHQWARNYFVYYPHELALARTLTALDDRDWPKVEAQLDNLTRKDMLLTLWSAGKRWDSQMPLRLVRELLWKCYTLSLLPEGTLFAILAACLEPAHESEPEAPETKAPTANAEVTPETEAPTVSAKVTPETTSATITELEAGN